MGLPNAGKSQLLNSLTNADSRVAEYPYTTRMPSPGMVQYENVQIQLVDLPPVTDESVESWLYNFLRNADLLMLVVDLADDPLEQVELLIEEFQKKRIFVRGTGVEEDAGLGDIVKEAVVTGTKADLQDAGEGLKNLLSDYEGMNTYALSAKTGSNLEGMGAELFHCLNLVRVYTKAPGKKDDRSKPFVISRGSSVKDLAHQVHHDFADGLKYARIWGGNKYSGQKVSADYVLEDEDVIELHA